jgi:AraC-like DNA-binding protein
MHTLKTARPRPELCPFVRTYAQRNIAQTDPLVSEAVPAMLEHILAFELGEPVDIWHSDGRHQISSVAALCGTQSRFAAHMSLRPGTQSFGIFFQPAGFCHLFGIPMHALTNRAEEADSVVGSYTRHLWNRMGESATFEGRVQIAEEFLMKRISQVSVQSRMSLAANYILQRHGAIRMTELADRANLGLRQFERQFRREVGVSPKTCARVARFQTALDAKIACPARTWVDIAHAFGYYDQMHMIHDFEKLGRSSPAQLIAKLGDNRPPGLMSSEEKNNECRIFTMRKSAA